MLGSGCDLCVLSLEMQPAALDSSGRQTFVTSGLQNFSERDQKVAGRDNPLAKFERGK